MGRTLATIEQAADQAECAVCLGKGGPRSRLWYVDSDDFLRPVVICKGCAGRLIIACGGGPVRFLSSLPFKARARRAFRLLGVKTVEEMAAVTREQILRPGIGHDTVAHVIQVLASVGAGLAN
jgi:hypothetical protein